MKFLHLHNPLRRQFGGILLAAVAAGTLLPASGLSEAAETRDSASPVAAKIGPGKISKAQATQNALTALPGQVTDVTIEKKSGKNVWVIEIVAEKTGAETDVLVDMDSGIVIGMDN
jgi:uncharacterized membrane protein YkoI